LHALLSEVIAGAGHISYSKESTYHYFYHWRFL
jgi:hypothetical protein